MATNSQNQYNKKSKIGSLSIYKGVSWNKRDKKWRCAIRQDGKNLTLGRFTNEKYAGKVYDYYATLYHKEFVVLNFPNEPLLKEDQLPKSYKETTTSKYKYINWCKQCKKWRVRKTIKGVKHHIGYFSDEEEAKEALDDFLKKIKKIN